MKKIAMRKELLQVWTLALFTVVTVGTVSTGQVQAVVVTFDELVTSEYDIIPDGYEGFDWNNFFYFNSFAPTYNPSGYYFGNVSTPNVAFNPFGLPSTVSIDSGTFDFNSAYLTSAWNTNLSIRVEGLKDGVVKYSKTVTVDTTSPTQVSFNFLGIDNLSFTSFGGFNAGYAGNGQEFVLDNFTFNQAVPEPSTVLGLLTAVGFGMAALRRKQKQ